jgi:hypothetical protein
MMTYLLVGMTLAIGQVEPGTPPVSPAPISAPGTAVPVTLGPALLEAPLPAPPDGWQATAASPPVSSPRVPDNCPGGEKEPKRLPPLPSTPGGASDGASTKPAPGALEWPRDLLTLTGGLVPAPEVAAAESSPFTITVPGFSPAPAEQARSVGGPKPAGEPPRRAMPSPFDSPPFPGSEYQGYPIIGVPPDNTMWPLMRALQGTPIGDYLITNKTRVYGWVTGEANVSTSKQTNLPDSYWIRPNNLDVDQVVLRAERSLDSVQTDHIDWGFRCTVDYGIDYRFFTAGGWFSQQLLKHNFLYGFDPTEQYFDVYIPWVAQGLIVRVGRWIACPDIETQFAPDNYLGSHSILFTFDTYTQTGVMLTFKLDDQWTVQGVIHAGTDMAPWYPGAIPTGAFGVRWVSKSNNDAFYTWLNAINNSRFRRFTEDGQPSGHDNFNYVVTTWEHRFNRQFITKTESYFMWQKDAVVGGTPSLGPVEPFGGGGGIGADIPGLSLTYGILNYTEYQISRRDFITIRNEWWKDEQGERSGFPSTYTSHTIGLTHNFSPDWQIRPEIGYYRSWTVPAFDNGHRKNQVMAAFDITWRF